MAQEPINPLDKFAQDFDVFFKSIAGTLSTWKGNFVRNSEASFSNMTAKTWIRLTVIVCAYLLIRPWLLSFAAKAQQKQMEKHAKEEAERDVYVQGVKMTGNDLRGKPGAGKIAIPGVESDSEEEAELVGGPKSSEWGRNARVRQRKTVRRAMEIHEENLRAAANDSDEDIADLLE